VIGKKFENYGKAAPVNGLHISKNNTTAIYLFLCPRGAKKKGSSFAENPFKN